MLNRIKDWMIGVLAILASFFFYRSHTSTKAKERLAKDLEAEQLRTQSLNKHAEQTQQAISENNQRRAEVQAHLESGRRDYFERG